MSSEGSDDDGLVSGKPTVGLTIVVDTAWGAKRANVPLDATVGEFTDTVVAGCGGQTGSSQHPRWELEVPLSTDDGAVEGYHQVSRYERLVDALRGVQHRPQIVPNEDGGGA